MRVIGGPAWDHGRLCPCPGEDTSLAGRSELGGRSRPGSKHQLPPIEQSIGKVATLRSGHTAGLRLAGKGCRPGRAVPG
jgi:hypothetical protein